MDRRSFLRQVSLLTTTGLVAGKLQGADAFVGPDPLRLAVLNDLHHDSPECNPWFEQVAATVEETNPDICVLAGDLANKGLESSLVSIRDLFGRLKCPVYMVPGNHDCDVPGDTSLYEKIFPDRLNYVIHKGGWQLIFLDSTQGTDYENTRISDRTLTWLEKMVPRLDPGQPALVFTHFPLTPPIHMAPLNTEAVWERLKPLNVKAAFCGHNHAQHQVILPPVVTSNVCCARDGVRGNFDGDPRKGFWIVEADAETGRVDYRLQRLEWELS